MARWYTYRGEPVKVQVLESWYSWACLKKIEKEHGIIKVIRVGPVNLSLSESKSQLQSGVVLLVSG